MSQTSWLVVGNVTPILLARWSNCENYARSLQLRIAQLASIWSVLIRPSIAIKKYDCVIVLVFIEWYTFNCCPEFFAWINIHTIKMSSMTYVFNFDLARLSSPVASLSIIYNSFIDWVTYFDVRHYLDLARYTSQVFNNLLHVTKKKTYRWLPSPFHQQ